MIKKLKIERLIFLICLIICLLVLVISGLDAEAMQTENEKLKFDNRLLEFENRRLAQRNEDYFVENDILLRRLWEYEQKELEEKVEIYDIPLTESLQVYTYYLCRQNDLDYELVLAIMEKESDYREKVISSTNDYGIMQINAVNHAWLSETLNIDDFLDAEQNIKAGIYILEGLLTKYDDDTHKALMAYNMGEYNAQKKWDKGVLTSKYSRQVIEIANELKEEQL